MTNRNRLLSAVLLLILAAATAPCADAAAANGGRRMGPLGRRSCASHRKDLDVINASRTPSARSQIARKLQAVEVTNGSFDGDVSSSWAPVGDGYIVSTTESNDVGGQSIQVTNGGVSQTIVMTGGSGGPSSVITFGGYSLANNTGSGLWNDYSIYADVTFTDGTQLLGEAARFPGGTTTTWAYEAHSFVVPADKTVDTIDLHAIYRNDPTPGVVYFDDLFVNVEVNTLSNPGFEGSSVRSSGWQNYMGGYTVETTESHSGDQSIKVLSGGALQKIYPDDVLAGSTLTFSGYCKSVGAALAQNGPVTMSIYLDIKFTDGSMLYGQEAQFPGGTSDGWDYAENSIRILKDVAEVHVYAVYYGDSSDTSVVYFDDIGLQFS